MNAETYRSLSLFSEKLLNIKMVEICSSSKLRVLLYW